MTATFTIECTTCHAKFAGKPEYAGRRIRCPKCQEVFRVPEATPEDEPEVTAAGALAEEFDEWNVPSDFEYKIKEADPAQQVRCKFCHEPLQPEQVLCLKCGYHQKLDKKFETKGGSEASFTDQIPGPVPGEFSFGSFSLSTIPLAIGGGVIALLALVIFLISPTIFALLCLFAGLALTAIGYFWTIVVACREDVFQGTLVWFLPIYWGVYIFTR